MVIPLVYKLTDQQRPLTVALKHWPIWIELFFFYSYYIFVLKHGVIWIELFLAFFFSDFQQHRDLSISASVHLLIPQLNKFKTNWAIAFVNVYVGSCNYPSALPSQSILREFWLMTKICLDQDHLESAALKYGAGHFKYGPFISFDPTRDFVASYRDCCGKLWDCCEHFGQVFKLQALALPLVLIFHSKLLITCWRLRAISKCFGGSCQ